MRRRASIGRTSARLATAFLVAGAALALPAPAAADYQFVTKWGSPNAGAESWTPAGIATDSQDNVYVVDNGGNRIQKFGADGDFILQWGSFGSGDGQFDQPTDVAVNSADEVYVVDRGNTRIQKFTSSGGYLTQWGSPGAGNGQFQTPNGVGIDPGSGEVYVADSGNNRVQKFSSSGTFQLSFGSSLVFTNPTAVAVSSGGTVYVADQDNDRIQRWTTAGSPIDSFNGFSAAPANDQFESPYDVTVSAEGKVFVADDAGNSIERFSASGVFELRVGGTPGAGNGQLSFPQGVATGSLDTFVVSDYGNNRVQKFGADDISGSTVRMAATQTGNHLVFDADEDALNSVLVTKSGSTFTFTDTDAIKPGAGCAQNGSNSVTCSPGSVTRLRFTLENLVDSVTVDSSVGAVDATIDGGPGDDVLNGGAGNDTINGGAGNDTIAAGGGTDTASYAGAANGVVVTPLVAHGSFQSSGGAGADAMSDVENLAGSSHGDTLSGNTGTNVMSGGLGIDRVDYSVANAASDGVTVNLSVTTAQATGGAGSDTLSGFEDLTGSNDGDVLTGDSESNKIFGLDGDDDIRVRDTGRDEATCGAGADTVTADSQDTATSDCETVSLSDPTTGGGGGAVPIPGGAAPVPGGTPGSGGSVRPPAISGLGASKLRSGKPGTFRYTLSAAANVTLAIERPTAGRKSGRSCQKQTRKNRKKRKCTFYAPLGKLTTMGRAGANTLTFSGKLSGRPLKPGAYRVTGVAVNSAGRAAPATARFTVTR